MARQRVEPEPVVTAADVEARWRALQARGGQAVQEAIGQTEPLPLLLAGLGLMALGAARWLRRSSPDPAAGELQPSPAERLDANSVGPAVADTGPPSGPGAVSEAILRGLVEGLVASGILPRTQPVAPVGDAGDA